MRIHIAAVGRAKKGPELELYSNYIKRMQWPVTLVEVEEKRPLKGPQLKGREAELLLGALPPSIPYIALDERGRDLTSPELAARIERWQGEGVSSLGFIIGGADGLDESIRKGAALVLNMGRLTWPHMMVRAMLGEQIYRSQQILAGHPYHRV
jgi:23S rRNA (pseudouridine1915-N3)-methyltransferase